jgi:transposase
MDSDKRSAQVERLEVVETGRRRRWSEDEKLKIVLESLESPRQVAATARRYGISRSLLLRWRQLFRPEPKDATEQQIGFAAVKVVPDLGTRPGPVGPASSAAIEIEFAAGVRMRITGAVDAARLTAAVAALVGGQSR